MFSACPPGMPLFIDSLHAALHNMPCKDKKAERKRRKQKIEKARRKNGSEEDEHQGE